MAVTTLQQKSILTQVVSPVNLSWQQCLNRMPHDFYHLPGYLALEAQRHNAIAEAIIIQDESEVFFLPYLIRECDRTLGTSDLGGDRIYDVISPYGYPGMLVSQAGQNPRFIKKCLGLIQAHWRSNNICSAFIRLHPLLNIYIDPSFSDGDNFVVCDRGNVVVVDLTADIDEIWKQTRANHRTKINKLKRAGFTTRIGSMDEYLDVFMDIYHETMNRVNASSMYYFTRDYFNNLAAALGNRINICVVETNDQIVAASLITELSGIVQYHLGGTRTEFLPQSPTTIMFNQTIEWAKQRNNRYLNLGGGLGANQDSLYHFKSGFSDRTQSFMTMQTIINNDLYDRLMYSRAKSLGITIPELKNKSFFPVYRAY
jgi:Acetyltransferase (GNAT) domain